MLLIGNKIMKVNFGSQIQIRCTYKANDYPNLKNSTLIDPDKNILSALSKKINNKQNDYYKKLSLIDSDLKNNAKVATIRNNRGVSYLLTGTAATNYRNNESEFFRTKGEAQKPNTTNIIEQEKYLYDKNNKRVFLDLFVRDKNNKYELVDIKFVDLYGRPALLYNCDKNGQLYLPLYE